MHACASQHAPANYAAKWHARKVGRINLFRDANPTLPSVADPSPTQPERGRIQHPPGAPTPRMRRHSEGDVEQLSRRRGSRVLRRGAGLVEDVEDLLLPGAHSSPSASSGFRLVASMLSPLNGGGGALGFGCAEGCSGKPAGLAIVGGGVEDVVGAEVGPSSPPSTVRNPAVLGTAAGGVVVGTEVGPSSPKNAVADDVGAVDAEVEPPAPLWPTAAPL